MLIIQRDLHIYISYSQESRPQEDHMDPGVVLGVCLTAITATAFDFMFGDEIISIQHTHFVLGTLNFVVTKIRSA